MFEKFLQIINNPVRFRLFLITKLPSAFFSGVRIKHIDENECTVIVPYKWFSKNPFRSTYFACLSMAAEMSTGVLAMGHSYNKHPAVSMLVTKVESNYFKKAIGITAFTCGDGAQISAAIKSAVASGESHSVITSSVGLNESGETVATFLITWSFKSKAL